MSLSEGYILNADGKEVEAKELRVFRSLSPDLNPLTSDFTILGFRKISPNYIRGVKYKATYECITREEIIVEKLFSDVRDENGLLVGLQVIFNWYCEDNTIGLTKTEIVKNYNKIEAETEERKRRERQIDYLIGGAKGTPIEQYVDTIFLNYHSEQILYKEKGTSEFADAILAETNPAILPLLAIVVPRVDDPSKTISVKNSILYQLGNKTLAEIESE